MTSQSASEPRALPHSLLAYHYRLLLLLLLLLPI
jgi:hypothetical protein